MKNSTLIISATLILFCLASFGFMNQSYNKTKPDMASCSPTLLSINQLPYFKAAEDVPDLIFAIESRFMTRITKKELHEAKSIIDILPKKATTPMEKYEEVKVAILNSEREELRIGFGDELNDEQKELLARADYSSDFYISADGKSLNEYTGDLQEAHLVFYMTVVPEQEAEYSDGFDSIADYIKSNSQAAIKDVRRENLNPGKVSFTVTKNGTVRDLRLKSSSGYHSLDNRMLELLTSLPGTWNVAKNFEGQAVDQTLVLFFGVKGC